MKEKTVKHGQSVHTSDPPDGGTGTSGKGSSLATGPEESGARKPTSFDPPDGGGSSGKTAGFAAGDSDS